MSTRESIQRTLLAFRSGELTTRQATERLMAADCDAEGPRCESLISLLSRLGDPPADVVAGWCEQLRVIAEHVAAITTGPLPNLEPDQLGLSEDGVLTWRGIPCDQPSLRRCPQRREEVQRLIRGFERFLAASAEVSTLHRKVQASSNSLRRKPS